MVDIYNQAVQRGIATDDDQPVTVADRKAWFDGADDHYPIWVAEIDGQVVGWVALEEFFHHPNYQRSAQIAIYFDYGDHRQSFGSQTLQFIDRQAPQCGLHTVVAYIFDRNLPSQRLFTKSGYQFAGDLVDIARINGEYRTVKTYLKHFEI